MGTALRLPGTDAGRAAVNGLLEAVGQPLVVEPLYGPPAGRGPHPPSEIRVIDELLQGRDGGRQIAGIIDDQPGHAVLNRLVRPAGAPCDLRQAGRSGLQEDNAKSLLFQPEPALIAQHRHQIRCAVELRHLVITETAGQPDRGAGSIDEGGQIRLLSTGTADDNPEP
jgi:hypothetical protein